MAKGKSFFSRGRKVQTTERMVTEVQNHGLIMHRAGSGDGGEWVIDGRPMLNFGSCSYLGLERHPALMEGAKAALQEFGSNFSISRTYLECPLYEAIETAMSRMMERHIIVAPSTTMAHLAALPVLVGDNDLVLVDQFAHASVHMATELIADVPIELLRHNRCDLLERRLNEVGDRYERVWYLCDGLYSMLGDFTPFTELSALLDKYPRLHLYVDDAHAMSWTGRHGRGAALTHLGHSDRVVVAVSMSKAFGATGGALALPSAELRGRIRRCGGPLMFSGPIPPAGLGAALASAELHLRPEFETIQAELMERVSFVRAELDRRRVALATDEATPIFMIHFDSVPAACAAVSSLRERGIFCCVSAFPAVPINKPSIRFTVSRHNSMSDLQTLVDALAELVEEVSGTMPKLPETGRAAREIAAGVAE